MGLIFRNDDVSVNTNFDHLKNIYQLIHDYFPEAEIWSCVTLFAKKNCHGSIYPNVPFRNMLKPMFYEADEFVQNLHRLPHSVICSHGLYHLDHATLGKDAQEMSIIGSCKYLKTNKFVPPFNSLNADTIQICNDWGIELVGKDNYWKNFEKHNFTPSYERWYFHSWRYTDRAFKTRLLKLGIHTSLPC